MTRNDDNSDTSPHERVIVDDPDTNRRFVCGVSALPSIRNSHTSGNPEAMFNLQKCIRFWRCWSPEMCFICVRTRRSEIPNVFERSSLCHGPASSPWTPFCNACNNYSLCVIFPFFLVAFAVVFLLNGHDLPGSGCNRFAVATADGKGGHIT